MKKKWLLLIFSLMCAYTMAADDIQPLRIEADISLFEVGNDISYLGIDYKRIRQRIMVNQSTLLPFFIVRSEGYSFLVAFQDNIVRAIYVGEPRPLIPYELFKTPEGVFVGMSYREVLELVPNIRLYEKMFWAYEAILPSGWKIGFMTGKGADYFPSFEDKITMIYKN
jgi:hypothetical protein